MPITNHYKVLGVSPKANQKAIQRAYHQKAMQYHPDVNKAPGATAKMVEVNEAYAVLSDDKKRKAYDRLISVSATTTGRAGARHPSSSGTSRARQEAERKAQEAARRQHEREEQERHEAAQRQREWEAAERRAAERSEQEARRKQEQQEKAKREAEERDRQERERAKPSKIGVNTVAGLAAIRRPKPYIHISWLAKLLADSGPCEWEAWFKTQHESSSWEKVPSDFNLAKWQQEHDALLRRELEFRKDTGATLAGYQKRLIWDWGNATLDGTPDLIYVDQNGVLTVQDCRTGKPRDKDRLQIMLCMWALPLVDSIYSGRPLQGRVVYPKYDCEWTVPASAIDDSFISKVNTLIDRLADKDGVRRFPSFDGCRFCDIPKSICEDRIGN